jgi:hypothetical protein
MAKNGRAKGKRGELEWAALLRVYGWAGARRSQQFCGTAGDGDVVGVDGLHFEVKRVEQLNLRSAMEQAILDAAEGDVPVVAHKRNRSGWMVTLRAEDFLELMRCAADDIE